MKQQAKTKVLFITGAGHCGSTLVDLMLGAHSKIVSAGEFQYFSMIVAQQPSQKKEIALCSCGETVHECSFWRKIKNGIIAEKQQYGIDIQDKDTFSHLNSYVINKILSHRNGIIFCDSSKERKRLDMYLASEMFDTKIIHVMRDGRAVARSYERKGERLNKAKSRRYSFYSMLQHWKKHNLDIYRYCNDQNYLMVKYEELVCNPKVEIARVFQLFGLSFEEAQLDFSASEHHIIGGNRMKLKKNQKIVPDLAYLNEIST